MPQQTRKPTPTEQAAMDKIARVIEPDAWAEYDAGGGVCSNQAGFKCLESIRQAQRLIRSYPSIVQISLK